MAVQDDSREAEMRDLFGLSETPDRKRSDVDAVLTLPNRVLKFELKSTTRTSFSTVRDLGPEHIEKWATMHWLFAFYDVSGRTIESAYYGSPAQLLQWVTGIDQYIRPDQILAELMREKVDESVVDAVLGQGDFFTQSDAERIQKRQWTKSDYLKNRDLADGFSRSKMHEILKSRVHYLIARGSTLNNPHIPGSYVRNLTKLSLSKTEAGESLLKAVQKELEKSGN